MADPCSLVMELDYVRQSGALGRSELIVRLFDFLAKCTLDDRTPKEAEVGAEVFGRKPDFDTTRDAAVRVYVHKLRRKLDALYEGPRRDAAVRINIPRGEYRLVLEPLQPVVGASVTPNEMRSVFHPIGVIAALILMLGVSAATWFISRASLPPSVKQGLALRADPVWAPLLANRLPTVVVVGDYYIFGESDDGMNVARLVREYTVNSAVDLNAFLVAHPKLSDRYVDLDLRYLPIGSAYALRSLAPILMGTSASAPPRVIMASELSPAMIRSSNIIYIGYLSGLGALRNTVFAGSRFAVGDSYDQLLDTRTKRQFISGGGGPDADGAEYRDYGYLSSFSGPAGGRLVIIAGTRDVGLMQTAEAASNISALRAVIEKAGAAKDFEALYTVEGMKRQNVEGKLIVASPIDGASKWNGSLPPHERFPSG
jgi:hypothetical protein